MKDLAALLLVAATATVHAAPRRVIMGGALSYTAQGAASSEMIGFGVSLIAETVSALAYDGCPGIAVSPDRVRREP